MNTVRIQLKNNHWYDAVVLPGNLYQATLPSGRVKTYAQSDVKEIILANEEDNTNMVITNKEDSMITTNPIQHYLYKAAFTTVENTVGEFIVRVVTNMMPEALSGDYNESIETKNVVNKVFAIQSGTWVHHLLIERLHKLGIEFKVRILSNKDFGLINEPTRALFINNCNFMFANADYSFFVDIKDYDEYGLDFMGLHINHSKKAAKRLQELIRQVEMFKYNERESFDIGFKDFGMEGDFVKFFDGKSYIRKSFALQMAENIINPKRRDHVKFMIAAGAMNHVTLRILTPKGLIKGDAVIVKDGYINHDVVTHPDNLKSELKTNGWSFACIWEHGMVHNAVWDVQSEINFSHALTAQHHRGDILRIVKSVQDSLATGTLPSWLMLDEDAHNEDGTVNMEQLSDSISKSWVRWQANGLDVRAAQNLTYMSINGIINRMTKSETVKDGKGGFFYKKMWTPMSNAVLLTVNTWESAHYMGGFDFEHRNRNVCFYDKRVGFIISGNRFVQTYNLHGGWDLDDSVKVIVVKVFCSDPHVLVKHLGKTVQETYIPGTRETAKEMVLLVRSPNGPGEWSIEDCDIDSLPIAEELRTADLPVVDIAQMPLPQDILLRHVEMSGMPTGMSFTNKSMTRDDSRVMIEAQLNNPGVGRFCNSMMVWASVADGFPCQMLAPMETIVDTVQQEHDAEKFESIELETANIFAQVIQTRESVDNYIAFTRMPHKARRYVSTHNGQFTETHKVYLQSIETIRESIMNHTLQMRAADPVVTFIRNHGVDNETHQEAVKFLALATTRISAIDRSFKADKMDSPFYKISMQAAKSAAMHELVSKMVAHVDAMENPDRFILTLWHNILTPTQRAPYGSSDRVIFQPNAVGERSLMDVLIEALVAKGWAKGIS